jgi:glucose/arabinose dehydrogenase
MHGEIKFVFEFFSVNFDTVKAFLMKKYIFLVCSLFSFGIFAQSEITIGTTTLQVDTIISGLDIPWEIIYGPDDHIWTTERKGIVSRINPIDGSKTVILNHVSNVLQNGESGMLGMVLHPNFSAFPEVFIAYTYSSAGAIKERIVKFTYNGTALTNEQILLDEIPGNSTHSGCRLFIMDDNTLILSTGDTQFLDLPQDINSLAGKVLRMNLDGSIPADNPISGSYVYTWGHRNVQGIATGPNGLVYLSEHGASSDDEFQILEANRNYGWPNVEGFCDNAGEISFCTANNVKEPLYSWTPTVATSDMLFYENPLFPEFHQKMLMTVLKDKQIIAIELDAAGTAVVGQELYLTNVFGRLRDICVGPNKEIYLATNGASWSNTNPNTHSIVVLRAPNNVGVNDLDLLNSIKTYPNPMTETFSIVVPEELKGADMSIFDLNGKEVLKISLKSTLTVLSTEKFSKGFYTLRLIDLSGNVVSHKLIKN